MDKKNKQISNLIIFLGWAAYAAAYIGRLNFNSYIEPIRTQLGATKTEMGLVSSFFFFAYGAGQLVHGILSRKYNTRYSVMIALVGSAAVNLCMGFCPSVAAMKYIWMFNGVFQSILWSSLIKTLSERLPDDMLAKAVVVMSSPAALGTFFAYGGSALFSSVGASYRWVFCLPAALLVLVGAVWFIVFGKLDGSLKNGAAPAFVPPERRRPAFTPVFVLGAVLLVFAAVSNGFIKDGVTTWMPSILKESYGMQESLSIVITVLLPLIAILGAWFSAKLHARQKNTAVLNGALYLCETVILLLALFTAKSGPVLLVALFAVSAMLMSAVNNIITSIIPMYMRDRMDSGLLAGVLDTFCYVGSTLSTALLGYIADRHSWQSVFVCLTVFGAAACVLCWVSVFVQRRQERAF